MKYFILTRCGHLIIKYKEFVSCMEQQRQGSWLYVNTICKCNKFFSYISVLCSHTHIYIFIIFKHLIF